MKKEISQEDSKIEVKGWVAKHYDILMNIITFGSYPFFIRNVIKNLELKKRYKILDFGAGTGRNTCLMLKYLGENGRVLGLEIGDEMIEQFKRKCSYKNAAILKKRIDEPFKLNEKFDLVFISFVLHGFIQEKREIIIKNAYNNLKKGGKFAILDYNEFNLDEANFIVRHFILKIECPLAEDFIKRDWKKVLEKIGFKNFKEKLYYRGYIRLLIGEK